MLAKAQQYTASVKRYGPEDGLSHREVNAIFQDKQGFMWFGTKFGLNRFDGLKFTGYTKERNGLGFDDIQSIVQDADGYLWLLGPYGQSHITLFNPVTNEAVSFEKKFGKQRPSTSFDTPQRLLSSANGTIFFTDYQPAVLISYHPKSGLRYVPLSQFKRLAVFQVTARNTVWAIADDQHLLELTPDGHIVNQYSHSEASIIICFGQRNAGIEFFYHAADPAKRVPNKFYSIDESGHRREWPYPLLKSLNQYIFPVCYAFDRTGLVWDGMSLRDSTKGVVLTIKGQTSGEQIENRSFFRDRNGLFWLGTGFGVYQVKLAENHFARLFYQENNKGKNVAAIRGITVLGDKVFANMENMGLYTSQRLGEVPKKVYVPEIFTTNGDAFASAYGLTHDGQGTLYGGIADQLVRYKPSTATHTTTDLPKGSGAWTLHPFGRERWLLGGRRGLMLYEAKQGQLQPFIKYNQFTELAQAHILHIAPDRQGTIWICANTGLYTIKSEKGITARYWSGGGSGFYLPAESYQHFYQDTQGIYWLATANAGLVRWDRRQNQYRQFRRSEGLSNDNIYAVYPDERGHLWMSSDYGIMQFDPVRFTTRSYFVEDGITHNEFNRIAHYQDKNGRIYFGGLNGITAFNPHDFQKQKPEAELPLRITSLRQYNHAEDKIVDRTDDVITSNTITIEPDDLSSELDFALLNYANAEKNVYAYQFKGINKEWTYQTEPSLRLNNLPFGKHQLLIKAQAADGQWSDNTLDIELVVVRPIYLRPWFLMIMVLLVGASIWAWLRWRIWQHQVEQIRLGVQVRQATTRIEQDKEIIEKQAQDLMRLNEARSHFFTNISHEFRTPLTVILGMAAELKGYKQEAQLPRLQNAAALIERNGANLLRLINQILDLSKIEAGEMHLNLVRADLVCFTRYIVESFQSVARAKDIQLHCHLEVDTCVADFDRDKLQDILSNLLSNSLKFTPRGGHIYYRLRLLDNWQPLSPLGYYEEITPTTCLDKQWVQFSVSDTGPGIEPATQPKVFGRFFQADNQLASQANGTGIGLSLVRELVLLMRGGLAVRNRSGLDRSGVDGSGLNEEGIDRQDQGAEFVVSIPFTCQAQLAQEQLLTPVPVNLDLHSSDLSKPDLSKPDLSRPDQDQWSEPDQAASGNRPVLLLVEDNYDVAAYIQVCIGAHYEVIWAEDGQAGIDQALEKMPDLVLSDVMMPRKDGYELCYTLKNDEQTSHIPIVLLTAKAAVDDRITGLRRGADAYLVKPFLREELLLVLGNLIQTRRLMQIYYSQLALGTALDTSPPAGADEPLEDEFVVKLRNTVEAHLDNAEFSVDDICRLMGMSRTTLHKKMTALTGLSMNRYLRTLRLRKAQELLSTTALNVSEVAYAVGFDDPKYFSRVFSEEFGTPPGNFRYSARD
ncbi:hybrid sensor histidine kinase/response regulator transcription factor [Telluribacter humicola]|uniref:hybrid sensor histidine kinase/response regulator transcription factor n=1 Tax=Telluribacter humicola TaxID=1720261 RepID=UPI001E5E463A|nr:two-component regulator propeller domain-containing protein [Telluribacter humicola]